MSKQLRVHHLAKELGVPSKAIVEKCRAEGIEAVTNHMALVSAGLAASIREWFSAGDHVTAVEAAAPVDLTKLRKPRARRVKTAAPPAPEVPPAAPPAEPFSPPQEVAPAVLPAAEREPAVAPAPAEPLAPPAPEPLPETPGTAVVAPQPVPAEAPPAPAMPVQPPRPVPPVSPVPPTPAPAPAAPLRPAATAAPAAESAAPVPEPIKPAGPRVVPRPAELRGPRLVRIERPEPIVTPRRAGPSVAPAPLPAEKPAGWPKARDRIKGKEEDREAVRVRSGSPRRQGRTVEVVEQREREWREQDVLERKERLATATGHGLRDRRAAERRRQAASSTPAAPAARRTEVEIVVPIPVKEFCAALGTPFPTVLSRVLEHTGRPVTINQTLDADLAELLALDLGVPVKIARARTELEKLEEEYAALPREHLQPRPPVVAMLGHVDHGKTSLLDAIRRTNVAASEAGGITQRIGAYRIDRGDWHVTFLDTPGHEAFTAMRARGAHLTDVVVLVVAADDGVMPQTVEAINHARAAGVTIVVALNKIDLPGVDLNRLYAQLAEHDLTPTEWGGHTDVIRTSALKGIGIEELISHLSELTSILDLKADPTVPAQATVIESLMREGVGPVAQVLVREGTLRPGQFVVCGPAAGRVRTLLDDRGQRVSEATPSTPVAVVGLDEMPQAGDRLYQVQTLARAKQIAEEVRARRREESLQARPRTASLEELLAAGAAGETPELNVIIKADGQGALDALVGKLRQFPAERARLNVLHAGVGAITEADVRLAQASRAIVIGYGVVAEDRAAALAEQVGVQIRHYRVIFEIDEDLRRALSGLLAPERRLEMRGRAEVRQIFHLSRFGTVAGCLVVDGVVTRADRARLIRDGRVVLEDVAIASLRRFKDDVREVRAGLECGLKLEGYDDVKPGDVIETYEVVETAARL